jgi:exonuclease SbcC
VANGQRFREFAQALNLRQLIDRANRHLVRLSPRYQLDQEVDPSTGLPTLVFTIRDRFQAVQTRAPKTLSGGESFLVSLSLALGLSDLRNAAMPIETLLLDEGFGTLDNDTLEVALAALGQLHAAGRQVGIISHVSTLQERIPARVLIEPLGEGRSRIRVP